MPTLSWLYGENTWEKRKCCDLCGELIPLSEFKKNAYKKRGKHKKKYPVQACYRCYYRKLKKKVR
jgi:hypothetical protein